MDTWSSEMSDKEKPNDHAGDMGFDDAPRWYACCKCREPYWNRPSLEGKYSMCEDCYKNTPISASGTVGQAWPKWVSVKERLPHDIGCSGPYLVWVQENEYWPSSGHSLCHFDKRENPPWSSNAARAVTHWCELPPAPKEGE